MTIIVISDSHGKADRVDEVLKLHSSADAFLFLGDGLRDIFGREHTHRGGIFAAVEGNCDGFSLFDATRYPREHLVTLGEYNILMMHGHTRGVKQGAERAMEYAASVGADILLYGHTHEPIEKYIPAGENVGETVLTKPLRVFNPGSLGYGGSYGLIQMRGKDILMSHGKI